MTQDSHTDTNTALSTTNAELPDDEENQQIMSHSATIDISLGGKRLDQAAAKLFPDFSRGKLQEWIENGLLTLNQQNAKSKQKVRTGDQLELRVDTESIANPTSDWLPENIPLDIIYEDEDVLVINKSTNCVVHPGSGVSSGTLANAVLYHSPGNASLPRCGIVHRLDKDTTGLLVIAKSLRAQTHLVNQLQERTMSREYRAIVCGQLISGGTIDIPIGRHKTQRTRMAVYPPKNPPLPNLPAGVREAVTHYRILQKFENHTELLVKLETGRTHQIRVHMAHIKKPLLGDATYNSKFKRPKGISDTLADKLQAFQRQALHAASLEFIHPKTKETVSFSTEPPEDYQNILATLSNS